jgi:hypothetical protein
MNLKEELETEISLNMLYSQSQLLDITFKFN